eukprot:COSAG02_NODE_218_length_28570_cov_75.594816_8_plen_91_part_00
MVVDRSSVVACVLLVGRRRAAGRGGDACACPATLVRPYVRVQQAGTRVTCRARCRVAFPHTGSRVAFFNDVSILAARVDFYILAARVEVS